MYNVKSVVKSSPPRTLEGWSWASVHFYEVRTRNSLQFLMPSLNDKCTNQNIILCYETGLLDINFPQIALTLHILILKFNLQHSQDLPKTLTFLINFIIQDLHHKKEKYDAEIFIWYQFYSLLWIKISKINKWKV